jgi:hypothetical protein
LGRLGAERAPAAAAEVLDSYGYELDRATVLRNCPFAQPAELVCTLNQHLAAEHAGVRVYPCGGHSRQRRC